MVIHIIAILGSSVLLLSCGVVSHLVRSVVAKFVSVFMTEHCVANFWEKLPSHTANDTHTGRGACQNQDIFIHHVYWDLAYTSHTVTHYYTKTTKYEEILCHCAKMKYTV